MALGDVFSPNFIIEKVTVKANEDIEKGEFVCNDGNGFVAATAALAALNRPGVALDAHDYSEETDHTIRVLFEGVVEAQKKANSGAVYKGNKLTISSTAGECQVFAAGDVTSSVSESTVEAANLVNLAAFGQAWEDAASAATSLKVKL